MRIILGKQALKKNNNILINKHANIMTRKVFEKLLSIIFYKTNIDHLDVGIEIRKRVTKTS